MTSDAPDDDRTVIRPPGSTPPTGFQRTEWSAGGVPAMPEKTQVVAPPVDDGGHLPVGTMLAEFRLTELIGEGGFGVVYKAFDTSLEREVALKEYMPSSLAQRIGGGTQVQVKSERYRETFEAGRESFVKEAKMLASFDHPSLVKVYRFWEANGTAYMVMPLLKGTTLKDVLRDMKRGGQAIDEAWLRGVLGQITEALLVIHTEQVYHRDIAPDNVMFLPEKGRWLLLDFGAARRVISEQTQALTVILKPGYAPVEQYAEIPGMKQGAWTDVYALAAVVYFAIIGKTPPPSVGRILNDTYQPLVESAAGRYSEGFLAAVDRALAVRPEHRTQSIGELRQDLGLGEASPAEQNYATQPLPPGTEMPARYVNEPARAATAMKTLASLPPAPAPAPAARAAASSPAAAPAPARAPAAPAAKGNGVKIGVGVGVLLAVAVGGYLALAPKPRPAPVEQAAAPAPPPADATPAPPPAVVQAPAPAPAPTTFDPAAEFERMLAAQTAGFGVRAEPVKAQLKIGVDEFRFNVTSDRDGYVYVYGFSSDGTLALIVPNTISGAVRVKKGQTWRFPTGNGFALESQEPAGPTQMLVMVSARQRNLESAGARSDGPVKIFPTGPAAVAMAAGFTGRGSVLGGQPVCPASGPCDDEYGAALMRFDTQR
jgi:serine/threonine protein kinase